eukprot:112265-Alexandrium_andersonii.AAC.1
MCIRDRNPATGAAAPKTPTWNLLNSQTPQRPPPRVGRKPLNALQQRGDHWQDGRLAAKCLASRAAP